MFSYFSLISFEPDSPVHANNESKDRVKREEEHETGLKLALKFFGLGLDVGKFKCNVEIIGGHREDYEAINDKLKHYHRIQ